MNGIAVIWKPSGITSHDVVYKVRRTLKMKRVGHTGTLDPMAEGILPICVGRATRAADIVGGSEKEYLAVMRLGVETDTLDAEGEIIKTCDANVSDDDILSAVSQFSGEIMQIPPMYSAVHHEGKRLYELARKGITVERKPRKITIHSLSVLNICGNDVTLNIVCSRGTYIRTLCADIGSVLGCGAHMSSLERTRSGVFDKEKSVTLAQFEEEGAAHLMPVDTLFMHLPKIILTPYQETRVKNGAVIYLEVPSGEYRLYAENGDFLCVSRTINEGERAALKMVIGFY